MNAHGFTSMFAPQLDEYLAFKEKMGFYGSSRIWYLQKFDAYCAEHDRRAFDRDTVEGWVSDQLSRSGRYRSCVELRTASRANPMTQAKLAAKSSTPLATNPELVMNAASAC